MKKRKTPMRMCIVCRGMFPKNEMLRIVKDKEGNIEIDESGKKSGRGAYICSNEECVNKAIKTRAVNRSFKTQVDNKVYEDIERKS